MQKKSIRRAESMKWIGEWVEKTAKETSDFSSKRDVWQQVLRAVVSPQHNGTNKEPHMTWHQFFEEAIGCEILDIPDTFKVADLAFEVVIAMISTQIGALQKEQDAAEKRLAKATKRKLCMENQEEKRKTKDQKKAEKFLVLKDTGRLETDLEEKRLAHALKFTLVDANMEPQRGFTNEPPTYHKSAFLCVCGVKRYVSRCGNLFLFIHTYI